MSAPLSLASSSQCCSPPCTDQAIAQVPGPKGNDGTNGTNGTNGNPAFTNTNAVFAMPAVSASVTVPVLDSSWIAFGQIIFVQFAGFFSVAGIPDSTHVTLTNLGYPGNAVPTTVIASGAKVSPGGLLGPTGSSVSTTLNALSPTTTKGDVIVDNGASSPSANDVRLGVGTNGKALVADSTQPTGLNYATITPNTVTNANDIPRFSGTSGTPMAVKDSGLLITDDGAIQSTPTGGNARGSKAVDLQVDRTGATQVASGANSVIAGGKSNTASAGNSAVLSGLGNNASGPNATISGGTNNASSSGNTFVGGGSGNSATNGNASVLAGVNNTASGGNSTVGGGTGNTASAGSSAIGGGGANTASGQNSTIPGGSNAVADKFGQLAHASGSFVTAGDAQRSEILARNQTSDATPTLLFLDGSSAKLTIPTDTLWGFLGQVVGRTSAGVCGMYSISGAIKNNGGVTTLCGSVTVAAAVADGGWPGGASVTITADAGANALQISVIGAGATSIRWLCRLDLAEVSF